jgi:hypothetical protein
VRRERDKEDDFGVGRAVDGDDGSRTTKTRSGTRRAELERSRTPEPTGLGMTRHHHASVELRAQ